MVLKRIILGAGVAVAAQLLMVGTAEAATRTWTGGGANNNMTTAANWGGTAPVAGDDLIFPMGAARPSINNNFTADTEFNSITFNGAYSSNPSQWYTISGNDIAIGAGGIASNITGVTSGMISTNIAANIDLTSDIAVTAAASNQFNLDSIDTSTHNLTVSGDGEATLRGLAGSGIITSSLTDELFLEGSGNTGFTGTVIANSGILFIAQPSAIGSAGSIFSYDGSEIRLGFCADNDTYTQNIILTGASADPSGVFPAPKLAAEGTCGMGGSGPTTEIYGTPIFTVAGVLSGTLTLNNDVTFGPGVTTLTVTGAIIGSHAISVLPGWGGSLVLNSSGNDSTTVNGTYASAIFTKTISDTDLTRMIAVYPNAIITVDGSIGYATMNGGTIKGTGTINNLYVYGGNLDPGHSPGVLNIGSALDLAGGTLDIELAGTAAGQFDQLNVTGTVSINHASYDTAVLGVSLVNGFKPTAGSTFVIINNDGTDAVDGAFKDLAEGTTFKVGNYVFKISYKGGDGNDVVLTVMSVPSAPNTGLFGLNLPSIWLVLLSSLVSATGLFYLAYRRAGAIG